MEKSIELCDQIKVLESKVAYMHCVADDAANKNYWALARFCRNEKQIAMSELRGINNALKGMPA
jgi:hypothetical protein